MLKIRFSVARKVGLAMVPILLGLAVAVTIPAWRMFSDVFVEQAEDQARMGAIGLLEAIESESIRTKEVAMALSFRSDLADAVARGDREAVLKVASPLVRDMSVDFATITDSSGKVIARVHEPSRFGDDVTSQSNVASALKGTPLSAVERGTAVPLSARGGAPIYKGGKLVGVVSTGVRLDQPGLVDVIKGRFNVDVTVFLGDVRLMTTVKSDGKRLTGTKLDPKIAQVVLREGHHFIGPASIMGIPYITAYEPMKDPSGKVFGIAFAGRSVRALDVVRSRVMSMTAVVGLLAFTLAVIVMAVVVQVILRPLKKMNVLAGKLALGDLTVKSGVDRNDEFGDLAVSLDKTVGELRRLLSGITSTAVEVSSSAASLREFSAESNSAMDDARGLVGDASGAASDNALSLEQVDGGIEEIAASANAVATSAVEGSEAAASMGMTAESAVSEVVKVIGEIKDVAASADETMDTMRLLGGSVDQISAFVSTITAIADQTNLLALNAAIEAARAGEAGRGFAVVAEEVRKLAEESNKAAKEVYSLMDDLKSRTKGSIEATEASARSLDSTADRASSAQSMLSDALKAIATVNQAMQNVAAGAEEQAAAAQEMERSVSQASQQTQGVAERMERILAVVEETTTASDGVSSESERLAADAQRLRDMLKGFTLEEGSSSKVSMR